MAVKDVVTWGYGPGTGPQFIASFGFGDFSFQILVTTQGVFPAVF